MMPRLKRVRVSSSNTADTGSYLRCNDPHLVSCGDREHGELGACPVKMVPHFGYATLTGKLGLDGRLYPNLEVPGDQVARHDQFAGRR